MSRVLRASEIGEYVYCHRAWWLHHVQGIASAHRDEMHAGVARHQAHGRAVQRTLALQRATFVLGTGAILLALAALFAPH